jgi:hypothetical protein
MSFKTEIKVTSTIRDEVLQLGSLVRKKETGEIGIIIRLSDEENNPSVYRTKYSFLKLGNDPAHNTKTEIKENSYLDYVNQVKYNFTVKIKEPFSASLYEPYFGKVEIRSQ